MRIPRDEILQHLNGLEWEMIEIIQECVISCDQVEMLDF